ncbi:Ig-like domain-containing protein [Pelotomaculum terephthalicicum JT]|uniref:Ig-like domain-containing protein n=1 Tax=Pelotomaculum TaxID=191373 RepID=UPI0009D14627|nr:MULTISPECIES: Ig-like domain-containing protein [Pelotomaculum]MCG9968825.1 Ig-like domain-containing protein [Pelotomaculum terephthalicicum JT]OPX89774.1 MAG: anaerobic benzoate catabolism transcriptional regulator [Pelotomaculum sp. PtaB.Bin117]OPY63478.1 MAG: anaerobic benzoate catabolism transcriptional regulator [Pelotomaculum sp. PtaU1.Bin065]
MNFGSRLRQIRESQMLSTSKLSKQSGLSQSFIWRIESGEKQPTLETLRKLSQGLGMSLGELLGEELLSEPESLKINRIIGNIRKLPSEQVDALDLFIASLSTGYAAGENPLTLQAIKLNHSAEDGFEIEVVFSANVSAIMDHRIPDGTQRNMAGFHLFDEGMKELPIDVIPGNKRMLGRKAERTFVVRPRTRLNDGRAYKLNISRLLQANNYKYLKENHTIMFSTHEIIDITPFNKKLCGDYLSFALDSSNIAPGDENIPVNMDIKLTFSNNVITDTVRDHNMQCFSLENSKKQPVEIDVIMAEPGDSSEKKKEIIIHPKHGLQSNTVYVLTISENLQAGNQKLLGTDKIITFTTGGASINGTGEQDCSSIA